MQLQPTLTMNEGTTPLCAELKTDPKGEVKQWESEAESLVQEKVPQRKLQGYTGYCDQKEYTPATNGETDILQRGDGHGDSEVENVVYDSLEESSDPHDKRNCLPERAEYLDTKMDEKEWSCQQLTDETLSDLCDDPSFNLSHQMQNSSCSEMSVISAGESDKVSKETATEGVEIKGGYRYIVVTSPADVETPLLAANNGDQPYRLHREDDQTGLAVPRGDGHALQDTSEDNSSRSSKASEDAQAAETQTDEQKESGRASEEAGPSLVIIPTSSNKKQQTTQTKDIVDRNIKTLGRAIPKRGSYVRKHVLKKTPVDITEEEESQEESSSAQNQNDSSELEQKTELSQETQVSKQMQPQHREDTNPSGDHQRPVVAKLNRVSSLPRPAAGTRRKHKPPPSKSLPTTINVSISLDSSSQLLPLLQQKDQDTILSLASLQGHPHLTPGSELSIHYEQNINFGMSGHLPPEGFNLHHNMESGFRESQKVNSLPWPLSFVKELQSEQFPQSLPDTPNTATSSQSRGSYPVLPPIGKLNTGDCKSFGQSLNTAYFMESAVSESYVLRMEKERELKAKEALKQQKTDLNRRALPPDYSAMEYKAEKMKRQKLYSNVIRNMNKHLSRIPFLPAKGSDSGDKKVPRTKALEYAKTIAKPRVVSQSKQRQESQTESRTKFAPSLQGCLDAAELARMDLLKKRHEEEKKAVASFKKHTI